MRGPSLQAIRGRVERLAATCIPDVADTTIVVHIHIIGPQETCPSCGYDLVEHAKAEAVAKAQAQDAPGAPPRRTIICFAGNLAACPVCGAALASGAAGGAT
jgi:Na+-translocating ferredoxin:NAD+ oxidoreductase RNF subunit RnfB